jgi:hypothetical protein
MSSSQFFIFIKMARNVVSLLKNLAKFAKSCKILLDTNLARFLRNFFKICCKNLVQILKYFFKGLIHMFSAVMWCQTYEQSFKLYKIIARIKNFGRFLASFFKLLARILSIFLSRDIYFDYPLSSPLLMIVTLW